ncbi:MAG: cysteine desulfurase [Clostridiales bacterium]|nr:cysteine desulfurase [Candidatus Apopatousia equi]
MKDEIIFLDNASTTKINEEVNKLIYETNENDFYNPSALYHKSVVVKDKIETAKKRLADILHVNSDNLIFTSGATESNNLAIMGSLTGKKDAEYIFSSGEHPSVYMVAKKLEEKGYKVNFIKLLENGEIDIEHLKSLLNENTHFVSVMYVSNETGAINDIEKISRVIKEYNKKIILHIDGVQAFGKIPCNLEKFDIDAFTISAHKFNGPKGVGALYYKNLNFLKPQMIGGGQQNNLRSGTENISGILGLVKASEIANENLESNYEKAKLLKQTFIDYLKDNLNGIEYEINSSENASPYIISISFKNLKSEILMHLLEENGVIIGTGSACSSKKQENRVLSSMGKKPEFVKGNIRISFSANTTLDEVSKASTILCDTVKDLKKHMSR